MKRRAGGLGSPTRFRRITRAPRAAARACAVFVFALALAPACAHSEAAPGLLRGEFWAETRPVASVGDEWPVSAETARLRILEEAAWVYSGLVWGFEFEYTPYDKTRGLAERFALKPLGSISPAQLRLVALPVAASGAGEIERYRYYVEYPLTSELSALVEGHSADPWKGSQGTGTADMNKGIKGRHAAYEDSLRLSVRSLLQGLEPNKPREVHGRVAFERLPSLALVDGFYTSRVRARVMVVESIPYKLY